MTPPRSRRPFALVLASALAAAGPAGAQGRQPDVVDFALGWMRGGFRSPVVCTFAGTPRQGLRRVLIVAGPPTSERRVDRITFLDLEAAGAERCRGTLGGDVPNVVGSLLVGYTPRRPNSDTPERDFQQLLREGPLPLSIESGRLRIGAGPDPPERLSDVDFTGGRGEIGELPPGSDDARLLRREFGARRQLRLVLRAPDGTSLELPLVEFEPR
jgi:hypothetical protein